jgi:hypothetical protein
MKKCIGDGRVLHVVALAARGQLHYPEAVSLDEPLLTSDRGLGGPHSPSGHFGKEKNLLTLKATKLCSPEFSLVTIPTELTRLQPPIRFMRSYYFIYRFFQIYIVTCIPTAKQRLGKHIPAEANSQQPDVHD